MTSCLSHHRIVVTLSCYKTRSTSTIKNYFFHYPSNSCSTTAANIRVKIMTTITRYTIQKNWLLRKQDIICFSNNQLSSYSMLWALYLCIRISYILMLEWIQLWWVSTHQLSMNQDLLNNMTMRKIQYCYRISFGYHDIHGPRW